MNFHKIRYVWVAARSADKSVGTQSIATLYYTRTNLSKFIIAPELSTT